MAYIIVVNTKRGRKERDRIVDLMTDAAGTQPSVFAYENKRGDIRAWRIQHNDLGSIWMERMGLEEE